MILPRGWEIISRLVSGYTGGMSTTTTTQQAHPLQNYTSTLEMIGRTPMLEATNLDTGNCRLFLKLELNNPAGSISR